MKQFNMNLVSANVGLINLYVIQGKNGAMINVHVNANNRLIRFLVKKATCGIIVPVTVNAIKHGSLVSI